MATSLLRSGEIRLDDNFLPDSHTLYESLISTISWDERIRARKAASFGLPYHYSGITWPAADFPARILPILDRVSRHLGYAPNNCLAHYYPDGNSTMGYHSDATDDLEPGTGITVVSLGGQRTITFRHQLDRTRIEAYPLTSGSLLVMSPGMQSDWKHAILTARDVVGGRISLTFRRMKAVETAPRGGERSEGGVHPPSQ